MLKLASGWMSDSTAQVTCGDDGPNPTDGPGPTNGGETTTTPKPTNPGPGGMQPTIVAIKRQTVPGSDVFIIGGVAPDQQIDIRYQRYNEDFIVVFFIAFIHSLQIGSHTMIGWLEMIIWIGMALKRDKENMLLMKMILQNTQYVFSQFVFLPISLMF